MVARRNRECAPSADRPDPVPDAGTYRTPWLGAGLATLAVFTLYVVTLARTTQFWDTSEYIATAHILGIPHPPGNPLFVVLARAWELLLAPFGFSIAVRINLFSAAMSALAHGFWFLLAHRIIASFSDSRRFRAAGAAAAVLIAACAFTVWNQSDVNEKVYTVSLLTIALLSWLAMVWRDRPDRPGNDNLLVLMVFVLALSVGNHLMAFLAAPALLLFVLLVRTRSLLNWKLYPAVGLVGALGLSIHLFLPIRAGQRPVINEASPTCPDLGSAIESIVTMGRRGCENLSASLDRRQYLKPGVRLNPIDGSPRDANLVSRQALNYAEYFDWQWARSVSGNVSWFGGFRPFFTLLFAALGIVGAWAHARADRISFVYLATLFATLTIGLTFYMNFLYGYTMPTSLMDPDLLARVGGAQNAGLLREVRERDYFFIVGFSLWGLWSGIGIAAIWRNLSERLRRTRRPEMAGLLASPVLGIALLPLILNWTWAGRSFDYTARDFAYNTLMSVEPYGILFTNGDNDTFPLWYLQEVEGIRHDVTVMVMSYLNTPWYLKQVRDMTRPCGPDADVDSTLVTCQRPYDVDAGPAMYAREPRATDAPASVDPGSGYRPPTHSIIDLTDEQIDRVASTPPYRLTENMTYTADRITATLPQGEEIRPSTLYMARMIQWSIGDRPIHFAMTTAAWDDLALRPWLIRQGLTYRLHDGQVQPAPGYGIWRAPNPEIESVTGPWLDVPRTEELLTHVFIHRGGFPDRWDHWVDSASEGVPLYYGTTHWGMAQAWRALGNEAAAASHARRAQAFLDLAFRRAQASR